MKREEKQLETIQKHLAELLKSEPLNGFNELKDLDQAQKYSLAQCWKDKGFRAYIENAVNINIKNAGLRSTDLISLTYNQARAILLKELLVVCKKSFDEIENIKLINKPVGNGLEFDNRKFIQEKIDATN